MSMLAGPRRKQKVINLRAKNNAWSNDSGKFGQRMLEKMGWTEGKGLGANENGIVEHVVARYKNDEKGLGFDDKNDQWTKHEDDFNTLLANLSNGDNNDEKLHSGVSLEVKSKKSKARVHYHKFTRGKDLTRYTEKDLANIFGKKSLKIEEKLEEPVLEKVKNTEQVFTEKGSMEDYFKNKLANIKSKTKFTTQIGDGEENNENDYVFKGFSSTQNSNPPSDDEKSCAFEPFSFYNSIATDLNNAETKQDSEVISKKKSKKKKSKHQQLDLDQSEDNIYHDNQIEIDNNQETGFEKPKKSKKKKQKKELLLEVEEMSSTVKHDDYVPKKKKKRKNKDILN